MAADDASKSRTASVSIGIVGRRDLLLDERMAADRALAIDHQRPGHDVGALHRDGDRDGAIGRGEIVLRPVDDRLAGVDVHGIVDGPAQPFGGVILHDA
jgi:hypothetical protein